MSAAELQQIEELWRSIMKRKQLETVLLVDAKNAEHN